MAQPLDLSKLSGTEKDQLILDLLRQNQELGARVAELEAKLKKPRKTPRNSGIPPSQGHKPNKSEAGKPGRKGKRGGHARELAETPDEIVDLKAELCPHCAELLSECDQSVQLEYDKVEIPPVKPVVTRVRLHGGTCPHCSKAFQGPVPEGLSLGTPFGLLIVTLAMYLHFVQAISFERLVRAFRDMFGLTISEGALANMFSRVRSTFADQAADIRARLLASAVICSDETGARVRGDSWWEWVFPTEEVSYHVLRKSRSKEVPAEVLGDYRPDVWVSDRYGAQTGWGKEWQVCLAHLLRDVQYARDSGDEVLAPLVKMILLRAIAIGRRREKLKPATLKAYRTDLDRRLDRAMALVPTTEEGKKLRKSCAGYRQYFFVFVTNPAVPATNNGSERALRPCTIFRKVTNCFRSFWGADLYGDVRPVLGTAQKQGISAFNAITQTLRRQPILQESGQSTG